MLMRHAKSDWGDSQLSDKDRPLNARGRSSAPIMAEWLLSNQLMPEVVLCSSAVRTRQTLDLLLEYWQRSASRDGGLTASSKSPEIVFLDELYLAPAVSILSIASKYVACSSVLVLGHNPGMEDVASFLSQSEIEMPTSAIVTLEAIGRNWPEDWRQASSWNWRGIVKPRDLGN
jgi:phosphohistidine phosphatase